MLFSCPNCGVIAASPALENIINTLSVEKLHYFARLAEATEELRLARAEIARLRQRLQAAGLEDAP